MLTNIGSWHLLLNEEFYLALKVFCLTLFAIPDDSTVCPILAAITGAPDNADPLNIFATASTNPAILCGMNYT
jgi:hypothetical protein